MKALSVMPEFAMPILYGKKTIEYRTWKTSYRGDLLICASSKRCPGAIDCHALCVVELIDIVPFRACHLRAAGMEPWEYDPSISAWAWKLGNVRLIKPFKQKGKLHLYDVLDSKIKILNDGISQEWCAEMFYKPLVYTHSKNFNEVRFNRDWNVFTASLELVDRALKNSIPEVQTVGAYFTPSA